MTRIIKDLLLTQCLLGFWLLSACTPAVLQTNSAPTPLLTVEAGEQISTQVGQVTDGPESSPVVATPAQPSLTQADHGKTIQLPLGKRFTLQLGDGSNGSSWEVAISDPNIVSRVIGGQIEQGGQGIYEAKSPGQTTLTATSSRGGENFQVTIQVPASESVSAVPERGSSEPVYLSEIQMVNPLEGWALGSRQVLTPNSGEGPQPQGIFRTTDGGLSWLDVTPPSLVQAALVNAYFASPQQARLVSKGREGDTNPGSIIVYSTEDGGGTWNVGQPINPTAGENSSSDLSFSITFVDDQTGWLLTGSSTDAGAESFNIYRTSDGGQSWKPAAANQKSSIGLLYGCTITGLTFRDSQTGWIAGSCGGGRLFFYITHDGGSTWAQENLLIPGSYPAGLFSQCRCTVLPPQFPDELYGVLPVSIAEQEPAAYLYLSQDGGQSWLPYTLPVKKLNLPPFFADAQHGWISDGKALYISRDGGQSWTWISKLPAQGVLGGLNFVTPQTGFLTDGLQLYLTQDGGVTWTSWQPVVKKNG
jgi:photosystem II stability/assembly factor-like uncharacterized protein